MVEARDSIHPGRGHSGESRTHLRPSGKRPRRTATRTRGGINETQEEGPNSDLPEMRRERLDTGPAGTGRNNPQSQANN